MLQRVYNKYGENSLRFGVLEEVLDFRDLIIREQYYIDLLKPAYNIVPKAGSRLGMRHSAESIKKISENNARFWAGKKMIDYGYIREGVSHTEESKKKMSLYARNRTKEHLLRLAQSFGKPVNQYNVDATLVGTYQSINEAARQTGLDNSKICMVCRGKRKKHGGFIWSYASSSYGSS